MKNLAKLQLQQTRQKAKVKPMATARTARAVPQMRKVIKEITGRKDGGTMENPKKQDRRVGKYESKKNTAEQKGRDKMRKTLESIKEVLEMTKGAGKELLGKQKGGVIRPKPTFKGKVLKPKPIKSRGIGIAIRGFGKAFKKGK
tara:strand:- start:747 stop:1178 length:432 start_codon:yes stop_codon:yes gene_type:complete